MAVQIGIDMTSSGARRVAVERNLGRFRVLDSAPRQGTVVVAVPSPALTVRSLRFPFHDRRRLEPMVTQELEHSLAFPLAEAAWDFVPRAHAEPETDNVFAVACPRARLEQALEPVAGQDVAAVDAEPYAYQRVLAFAGLTDALVADLGVTRSTFAHVSGGHLDFVRVLLHGSGALGAAVAAARNVPLEAASTMVSQRGLELSEVRGYFERLLDEALLPDAARSVPLYLCGGAARLPGLAAFLVEKLERPVELLPVPAPLSVERDAVALGMALQGVRGGEEVHLQARAPAARPLYVTVGVWLMVALGLLALDLRIHEWTARRQLTAYDTAIASTIAKAAPELAGRPLPLEQMRSLVAVKRKDSGAGGLDALGILTRVNEAVKTAAASAPDATVRVADLKLGEGDLLLNGEVSGLNVMEAVRNALTPLGTVHEETSRQLAADKYSFTLHVSLGANP